MKKLFLILAAAVALSSLAFAEPYGEKSRPDSAGDIVFVDGTAMAWREGLTLTDEQKAAAVAVIFYAGTGCSNDGEHRILGVGLAQNKLGIAWCTSSANAYRKNITPIRCEADGEAGALTFKGDLDGSDNFEQMGAFLSDDDTTTEANYPAFYYAKKYVEAEGSNVGGSEFERGWYLPSLAELFHIWKEWERVNTAIGLCGGTQFDKGIYWTSSQYPSYTSAAYLFDFYDGSWGYFSYPSHPALPCLCRPCLQLAHGRTRAARGVGLPAFFVV